MTLLWITLFLLHQGCKYHLYRLKNSLVPVVTVKLGEPVTFTCVFTEKFKSTTWLHWYQQRAGSTLKVISMQRKNVLPSYGPGFSAETFNIKHDDKISNLTILRTTEQDEGIYHCALIDWTESTWTGTYLSIKGSSKRTSNYTVVQRSTVSDPSRPADSETLQCSVLSDSEDETCSEDLRVFWFRARSDNSYPDFIYADGNRPGNCSKKSGTQRRCSYEFSKNIGSSDDGTFYCAVATCGQILFRQQIKLETSMFFCILLVILCRTYGQAVNYAALHFSHGKASGGKKKRELKTEESVYSQVKGPF
uniref:Ig-like domain-containing protein n=1 Tax=Kryptolebias marmoratus TaxID=37003 RepID=A0A3Q3B716_KRYMA